jgi:hypothetical protein
MIAYCIKRANLFYYIEVQLFYAASLWKGPKLMIEESPIP